MNQKNEKSIRKTANHAVGTEIFNVMKSYEYTAYYWFDKYNKLVDTIVVSVIAGVVGMLYVGLVVVAVVICV